MFRISTPAFSAASAKWMVLVASIWLEAFCGNPYQFYSSTLKSVLGYNQLQLNIIAVAKDTGENVGILAGLFFNKIPTQLTISIGAAFALLGYGMLWLVTSQIIKPLPYWVMLIVIYVATNSTTWFSTAVLVTCMRNFPHTRGTIAGFIKGFVGLSSALYTQIFIAFLSKDPVKLLFFLTFAPAAIALISMNFIKPMKSDVSRDEVEEHNKFSFIQVICIALTAYIFLVTVVEDLIPVTNPLVVKLVAGVTFLFLLAPLSVPIKVAFEMLCEPIKTNSADSLEHPLVDSEENIEVTTSCKQEQTCDGNGQDLISGSVTNNGIYNRPLHPRKSWTSQLPDIVEIDEDAYFLALAEGAVQRKKRPRRGEDFKLKQAIIKADFWLLFLAFFCGVGAGVTAVNNLAQIAESQGYKDVTVFVALVSIWNFLGRFSGGFVSEYYVRLAAVPRPVFMGITQGVMIIAHVLFSLAKPKTLHAASAILGICFGFQYSIMIPTASELFGLKHFGIIFNFFAIGTPLGSLFFSALLAGYIYDLKAEFGIRSGNNFFTGSSSECFGAHCFRLTFLIMIGVCIVGMILSAILSYRIRPVYQSLYSSHGLSSASLPPAHVSSSTLLPADFSYSSLPPADPSSFSFPAEADFERNESPE